MSAPSIVIKVQFERTTPVVSSDAITEGDQDRLVSWLDNHPALADLVERALELEKAA